MSESALFVPAAPAAPVSTRQRVLHILRSVGVFALARRLTRRKLRILCYHGISIGDQHLFEPFLFMRAEVFRRRMQILKRVGIPVVSLDAGVRLLDANACRNCETVVTIDDGWVSTYEAALPILAEQDFPACIYLTTSYLESKFEVFSVTALYLFWKSKVETVRFNGVHPALDGEHDLRVHRKEAARRFVVLVQKHLTEAQQQDFLPVLARELGLDFEEARRARRFRHMLPEEVANAARQKGIELGAHTHNHVIVRDSEEAFDRDLRRNEALIRQSTHKLYPHFCYPSGVNNERHGRWLQARGYESATTCEPGMNDAASPRFYLKRFLDRDSLSDIEFEAEVCGVFELARMLRGRS